MGHSILFSAIAMAVCLQSVVVVNCAPEYFNRGIVTRSNTGPTNGTNGTTTPPSSSAPRAVYNGSYPDAHQQGVYLRIANGGAGQAGLIGAWADAFIKSRVDQGDAPFEVSPPTVHAFSDINIFYVGSMVSGRYYTESSYVG